MKQQRNQLIYCQRTVDKRTLQSIADEHGIHKERVRQICCKEERLMKRTETDKGMEALWQLRFFLIEIAQGK